MRSLVKFNADPAKSFDKFLLAFSVISGPIGVFDSEDALTAFMLSKKEIKQNRAKGTDVEETSRTWGKTNSN